MPSSAICLKKKYMPVQCCGSGMFIPDPGSDFFPSQIPDPNCFHPGSRIPIKEFKYFNPKEWFLSSRKHDPGCSSRIPDPDPDFLPIPDPGSRIQGSKRHRIPDPDPQHCTCQYGMNKDCYSCTATWISYLSAKGRSLIRSAPSFSHPL
jgi:hypothetical protein